MSVIASRFHTAGNRRRWRIDYSGWLDEGVTATSAAVTLTDTTLAPFTGATIDTVSVNPSGQVVFWTNGGVVNELFTANVAMTDSIGEVKKDTVSFTVVAP